MYRIKLTSGDEANYSSIDELAQAVKAGTVTDTAAIYHARAEKWLPIASHPHYKMAKDRVMPRPAPGAAARPATTGGHAGPRPGVTASGQRPALTASGQRPAMPGAPRQGAPAPRMTTAPQVAATNGHATRAATAERPLRVPLERRSAPQPAQPAPKPVIRHANPAAAATDGLDLLRADLAIDHNATAPAALPDVEIEQTPTIAPPEVVTEAAPQVSIERVPDPVKLVSNEAPAGGIEFIHPDRAVDAVVVESPVGVMAAPRAPEPVSLDIPAPVRDFAPDEPVAAERTERPSRAPLFIGLGLAAAAVIGAVVFLRRPSGTEPAAAEVRSTTSAPVAAPAPPPPTVVGATDGATLENNPASGARSQGGASASRRRDTEPDPSGSDGLEPPPRPVIPAAPSVKGITDAAALPTVDAGALDLVDRQQALERAKREIDSSMRRESGKSGGSTR